jgi:hypothetical protein
MFSFFFLVRHFVFSFRRAFQDKEFKGLLFLVLLLLLLGVMFYIQVENWRFIDALYFCVITLTTVGFGDLAPHTDTAKIFTSLYVLVGIGVLLAFINLVAKHSLEGYNARRDEINRCKADRSHAR